MKYVVRTSPNPNREELKWAMKFTVRMRDRYRCQECGGPGLDIAHIQSRAERPDLAFEPSNARILCRPCHVTADHQAGHRPSGRPVGLPHTPATLAKMRAAWKRRQQEPEFEDNREQLGRRTTAQWDRQGRKPERDCESCGGILTRDQLSRDNRFCSATCGYSYRTGKPRAGW